MDRYFIGYLETSTILEQELRSWVGIGLHFLGVGNTLFTLALLQCTLTWGPPGLSRGLQIGKQPQFFRQMEDNLNFLSKWKTTSTA